MPKQPRPTKSSFNIDLSDLRIEFAGDDSASIFMPAVVYAAVRVVAKLLTVLVPMSSFAAFLTTILWLAVAIYLFIVVTWQRDDNWLGAGILIGATFLGGGLLAELIGRIIGPGSLGDAAIAVASNSFQMVVRALLLVPLSGAFVAGARWLTGEVRSSGAWNS
jgi:hypothetical protein